jgi:hypothetical protein
VDGAVSQCHHPLIGHGRGPGRNLTLATIVAALAWAMLATSAFAFDHHFYVHQRYRSGHDIGQNRFVRQDKVKDPHNRQLRVGRDRWQCRAKDHPSRLKCSVLLHLNGRFGGKGYIRAKGTLRHGDKYVRVVGGTRQFNGVAGRMFWNGIRVQFDLVR